MTTPGQLMTQIDSLKMDVAKAGDEYRELAEGKVTSEIAYEKALATERANIFDAAREADERMPSEKILDAKAHRQIDSQVWADFLMAKTRLDALDRWLRTRQSMLSACQTQLNHLDVELRNT